MNNITHYIKYKESGLYPISRIKKINNEIFLPLKN